MDAPVNAVAMQRVRQARQAVDKTSLLHQRNLLLHPCDTMQCDGASEVLRSDNRSWTSVKAKKKLLALS